jgi:O-antigen ligase
MRSQEERTRGRLIFTLFFACLFIPAKFDIGALAMTPDRMLMLLLFVPLMIRLLAGRLGRIGGVDVFIMLFAAWMFLSLIVWHGASRLQFAGITVVEMVGGYLFGRAMIRSEADYRAFFRQFYHALLFLLPFALIELFTARLLINDLVGKVFGTFTDAYDEQRWGLNRVQAVFQHPILYGLICSLAIANFYFLNRAAPARAMFRTGFALFMTFTSLSAGPLLSAMIQCGMIFWEKITKANWKLLGILALIGYVTIDLLSNRTPAAVIASYASFDAAAAYNRILIWRIGIQNVIDFPIFGIGMNEWRRTGWTWTASVDNFWLVIAMRHGVPAFLFLVAAMVINLRRIFANTALPTSAGECRSAYLVMFSGLLFTLSTVHVWGAPSVLVMALLGAGTWMAQDRDERTEVSSRARSRRPGAGSPNSRGAEPANPDDLPQNRPGGGSAAVALGARRAPSDAAPEQASA